MEPATAILCPICSEPLLRSARSFACPKRHNFDVSREGYLSLLHGRSNYQEVGDDKAMIQARVRAHRLPIFQQLAKAIIGCCAPAARNHGILDIGCGDGFFLDQVARAAGVPAAAVGVDISKEALAWAAKTYRNNFCLRCDAAHQKLPFEDASFGLILSIFAPRPIEEIRRVLRPEGVWLIVTATPEHLQELRDFLPLAGVGEGKLEAPTSRGFRVQNRATCGGKVSVPRADLVSIIEMSPSIYRLRREMGEAWIERVPDELAVTVSFSLTLLGGNG